MQFNGNSLDWNLNACKRLQISRLQIFQSQSLAVSVAFGNYDRPIQLSATELNIAVIPRQHLVVRPRPTLPLTIATFLLGKYTLRTENGQALCTPSCVRLPVMFSALHIQLSTLATLAAESPYGLMSSIVCL